MRFIAIFEIGDIRFRRKFPSTLLPFTSHKVRRSWHFRATFKFNRTINGKRQDTACSSVTLFCEIAQSRVLPNGNIDRGQFLLEILIKIIFVRTFFMHTHTYLHLVSSIKYFYFSEIFRGNSCFNLYIRIFL